MKEKAIYMRDLHFEHEMWKKELTFCDQELEFLTKRLEEVTFFHEDEKDMLREGACDNSEIAFEAICCCTEDTYANML